MNVCENAPGVLRFFFQEPLVRIVKWITHDMLRKGQLLITHALLGHYMYHAELHWAEATLEDIYRSPSSHLLTLSVV